MDGFLDTARAVRLMGSQLLSKWNKFYLQLWWERFGGTKICWHFFLKRPLTWGLICRSRFLETWTILQQNVSSRLHFRTKHLHKFCSIFHTEFMWKLLLHPLQGSLAINKKLICFFSSGKCASNLLKLCHDLAYKKDNN